VSGNPALSVVLAGNDLQETAVVRGHLRRQTVAERVELILVLPEGVEFDEEEPWSELWGGQVVRVPAILSRGQANAAGVLAARSPIVVMAEDHAYPDPDWAAALLEDHTGDWVAVGPQVRNVNPATLVGWADFVIGYGPWSRAASAGESENIPGHNSSYKTGALLSYGPDLPHMLRVETVLHWDLRRRGGRLLVSDKAVVRHLNFSRFGAFSRAQIFNGRLFAGTRVADWGWPRRVLYALGSPLIPVVRAWRLRSAFVRSEPDDGCAAPWSCWGCLGWALALDAVGQMIGYVLGPGGGEVDLASYEFCRTRFVVPEDRRGVEAD
jgi:hypothetical protein